jgi:putative endonuclease
MFFVYILESEKTGRWYVGHTESIVLRLAAHNAGRVKSSEPYIPYAVVYQEIFTTRSAAVKRELQIKRCLLRERSVNNMAPSSNG